MPQASFPRLVATSGLVNAADQLALAALPVTAVLALQAEPAVIGMMVSVQTLAWLIVPIPVGQWVDRTAKGDVLRTGLIVLVIGFVAALAAAWLGSAVLLAAAACVGAAGVVIFALAQIALTPRIVPAGGLTGANARMEFLRALSMFGAPVLVGFLAKWISPLLGFALAAGVAVLALWPGLALIRSLPPEPPAATGRPPFLRSVAEGARAVADHPLLSAIAGSAVFWNFSFVALAAIFLPYALQDLKLDAAGAGLAQGANGLGMIAGALFAPFVFARVQPRVVLLAGPGLSALGAALLLAARDFGGLWLAAGGYALLGFGPMLWLIMQTSLRQLVTPAPLMARATAMIQTAIYGTRPVGALAGGLVAQVFGLRSAMLMVVIGFSLSFLVAALSQFRGLKAMPVSVNVR